MLELVGLGWSIFRGTHICWGGNRFNAGYILILAGVLVLQSHFAANLIRSGRLFAQKKQELAIMVELLPFSQGCGGRFGQISRPF